MEQYLGSNIALRGVEVLLQLSKGTFNNAQLQWKDSKLLPRFFDAENKSFKEIRLLKA